MNPVAKSINTATTLAEPIVESKFLSLSQNSGEDSVKLKQLTSRNGVSKMFTIDVVKQETPPDTSMEIPFEFTLVQEPQHPYQDVSTMDVDNICLEDLEKQEVAPSAPEDSRTQIRRTHRMRTVIIILLVLALFGLACLAGGAVLTATQTL